MQIRPRFAAIASMLLCACALIEAQDATSGPWVMQTSGTAAGLRGIHAVGGGVAWASGTDGTVLRTEDSGYMWQSCALPPGAGKLDFRGIWAWDANTAVVMSSGPGDQSRLYKTADGCSHWKLLFADPDKTGFWDAVVFQNRNKGYILGDPVQDRFVFLTTNNGGRRWLQPDAAGLENRDAHGAFAASNSVLLGGIREPLLFGTGGGYVFAESGVGTIDFASAPGTPSKMSEQWTSVAVPVSRMGDAAGIFSIGYHEGDIPGYGYTIVAVGGDYQKPDESAGTAAWTSDGKHWTAAQKPPHGYRSAVAWDAEAKAWIAVGTNGSDISYDDGKTWTPLDNGNWNALSLPWVVGPKGRIAKLDESRLKKQ
jgi:photosystem II stability/assembly factor-like uncharacterized protein